MLHDARPDEASIREKALLQNTYCVCGRKAGDSKQYISTQDEATRCIAAFGQASH